MKILALPDLHGGTEFLRRIGNELSTVDLVLLVGDLTNAGSAADARRVVDSVRQYNNHILAVPGNWDGPVVSEYLSQAGISLHRRSIVVDGLCFAGVGASLPSPAATPNEITESDFESFLKEATFGVERNLTQILVCHQPPIGTVCDRSWTDLHLGSRAVRAFIEATQPAICFTGHIHEGIGTDRIGSTHVVNPGPLWQGRYAYAEIESRAVTVEIRHCREIA